MRKAWLIVFGLCVVSMAQAQQIRSEVDTNTTLIGKPITLTVHLSLKPNDKASFPKLKDTIPGGLELFSAAKVDTLNKDNKSALELNYTLQVTAYDSGFYFIPPMPVVLNGDSSKPLFSEPHNLVFTYPKVALDKEIKDIKPPYEPPFDWLLYGGIVLGALLLIALIVLAIIWFKKKKNPFAGVFAEKQLPPHEKALKALEELKLQKLWQNGQEKEYHSRLSEIVREYIEGRYAIAALEQVTDETLIVIAKHLDKEEYGLLEQLLRLSDMVKFARFVPGPGENELSINNAVQFVQRSMPRLTPEEVSK